MTQPPNGWGNQPLPPPPENGWQGQQPGQQPPMQSPPSWGAHYQQQFAPPPPPKKSGALKWVLGGTALLAVIAITAVVTISLSGRDTEGDSGPTATAGSGSKSEFASANDTGPISIITGDPSCAPWVPILNTLAAAQKTNNWGERDPAIPASVWSPEQRTQYQEVGQAMRTAADQTEPLIKLTTHRVMRQLYEQFMAYARAFAREIPTYTEPANALARTATQASNTLAKICDAITYGSAAARAPLVQDGPTPATVAPAGDSADPTRFLASPDSVCPDWVEAEKQYESDTADWRRETNVNIPAGQWSPEQKAVAEAVTPVMRESADTLEKLGQRSDNPVFQDFAQLAAQYRRAYVQAMPTYSATDRYIYDVAIYAVAVNGRACEAAGE
ncbi:hypothetical protein [Mycobacterium sp. NPDC004974]